MNHTIMVVDDSRVVYAEMNKMLTETEFEIAAFCRSGEEALQQYEKIQPDLVTMDIVMPGMDGIETARELIRRWPDAKILMVSSLAYDDTIDHARDLGARGFVYKPFGKDEFLQALRKACEA